MSNKLTGAQPNAQLTVDQTALSNLLDKELEEASAEEQRGGWTQWAIAGATAATVLSALQLWEKGAFSLSIAGRWAIVLGAVADLMTGWLREWGSKDERQEGRRYRIRQFEHLRAGLLAAGVYYAILTWLAWDTSPTWFVGRIAALLWFPLLAVVALLSALLSAWSIPQRVTTYLSPTAEWIARSVVIICVGIISLGYLSTIPSLRVGASTAELRFAALITVGYQLLFRFLTALRRPWSVRRLKQVRRELVLGKMDVKRAARATELALLGAEAHALLEEALWEILPLYDEAEVLAKSVHVRLTAVRANVQNLKAEASAVGTQGQIAQDARTGLSTVEEEIEEMQEIRAQAQVRLKSFNRNYKSVWEWAHKPAQEAQSSLQEVKAELGRRAGELDGALDLFREQIAAIKRELDKA